MPRQRLSWADFWEGLYMLWNYPLSMWKYLPRIRDLAIETTRSGDRLDSDTLRSAAVVLRRASRTRAKWPAHPDVGAVAEELGMTVQALVDELEGCWS